MIQNATPSQPVTIVEVVKDPAPTIDMIQVAVAAFGLTGVIMGAAVVAGFLAGALYIWYRSRGPASTIEARGHQHNLFRG